MTTEEHREPLSSEVKRLEGEVGPHAHRPLLHFPVFEQLKQRNLFRVAVLYVVVCWLILDPVHVIFHMAGVPEWVNRLVLIVMAVGFPLTLIFAWIYEFTPGGLKPTVEVPHGQSIRRLTGRRLDRAIIAALAVALVYFVVDKFWISRHPSATQAAETAQQNALGASAVPAKSAAFAPPPHSIAVLPLTNESGQASQQYFSDGISEDLITALSQFQGLKVIGRASSFQFRDLKEDGRSIGAKLGVAHLLEGSVRRSRDVIRVSAELIDTADGSTQWSEHYDHPYKDLFEVQDEITHDVAGALRAKLLPSEQGVAQAERPPSGSLEAYNALLQGRFYDLRRTEASDRKAIESYTQATQLDPRYALAWSGLSRAWITLAGDYLEAGTPTQEAFTKAHEAANRALALSPDIAAVHLARGYLLQYADYDWHGAEAEYRRAMELAPNDGDAKFWYGNQLATLGDVERAIDLTRQALITEPLRGSWHGWLAIYLSAGNRLDEAERAIRRAIELEPSGFYEHTELANIWIQRGNAQAALAAAEQEPPGYARDVALAAALTIGNNRAAADAALKILVEKDANLAAYLIAEVFALRNDANKTFEWLDRSWRNHDAGLPSLLYDPFIVRYKNDPRFAVFCRKVGLPTPAEAAAHKST